jgi:exosome complex RNA-binding protein Rrp42 (RNase PH superfamily)
MHFVFGTTWGWIEKAQTPVNSTIKMTTKRTDSRGNEDIRQTNISYDGLSRVDGSARFAFGVCDELWFRLNCASNALIKVILPR